jgi:adenylosuccinate lyase
MKKVWSEENKNDKWLNVEIAVCEAWTDAGVIPSEDMEKLRQAQYNPEKIREIFERTRHDMTAFLQSVTYGLGEEGRWLHMGLTSHDVQDTAQSLQLVEASDLIIEGVDKLTIAIKTLALKHKDTPIMGRTHGVHAEPTTFGLKMALWWEEMKRNRERLQNAKNIIAVGKISGAVGTYASVPPEIELNVCAQFGLAPAPISNQVIQRDRHAQFVTTLAIVAASLEKFATEVRGLQRTEVREVEEPFGQGQTGSSSMPHKKNPELSERVCGLARLIRGYAMTSLENVALWHERDISHSSAERLILPDSCMALDYILNIFTGVVEGLRVYPERMWKNIEMTKGLVFSQRLLIALLETGLSRERSYEIVQSCAMRSWEESVDFREIIREIDEVKERLPGNKLEDIFDYNHFFKHVSDSYSRIGLEGQ